MIFLIGIFSTLTLLAMFAIVVLILCDGVLKREFKREFKNVSIS